MTRKEESQLLVRRFNLLQELEQVNREIEEAQTAAYRLASQKGAIARDVLDRFLQGQSVVYTCSRLWWVDAAGDLLRVLDARECDVIKDMERQGIVKHET